jgi:hypothetical protein
MGTGRPGVIASGGTLALIRAHIPGAIIARIRGPIPSGSIVRIRGPIPGPTIAIIPAAIARRQEVACLGLCFASLAPAL